MKINFNIINFKGSKKPNKKPNNQFSKSATIASNYHIKKDEVKLSLKPVKYREVKELSNKEFKEYKKEVIAKLNKLKEDIKLPYFIINPNTIFLVDRIVSNPDFYKNNFFITHARYIVNDTESLEETKAKTMLADAIAKYPRLFEPQYMSGELAQEIENTKLPEQGIYKAKTIDRLLTEPKIKENTDFDFSYYMRRIISNVNNEKEYNLISGMLDKILSKKSTPIESWIKHLPDFMSLSQDALGKEMTDIILSDETFYDNCNFMDYLSEFSRNFLFYQASGDNGKDLIRLMEDIIKNKDLYKESPVYDCLGDILSSIKAEPQYRITKRILSDEKLYNNKSFMKKAGYIITSSYKDEYCDYKIKLIDKITNDERYYNSPVLMDNIANLLFDLDNEPAEKIVNKILSDSKFYNDEAFMKQGILRFYSTDEKSFNKILSLMDNKDILPSQIIYCLDDGFEISKDDLIRLNKALGIDKTKLFDANDTIIAIKFLDIFGIRDISEIPIKRRNEILKNLMEWDFETLNISNEIFKAFPLLPTNQQEYCSMVSGLVKLINVEVKKLDEDSVKDFYMTLDKLSNALSKMSDSEFKNLKIEQTYSKDDFIKDVLKELENLTKKEEREIFNYFNFELEENNRSKVGYSIFGYPKLPIFKKDYPTKEKEAKNIENYILKFNKDNFVKVNNPDIENQINKILNVFPELRLLIGKVQSGNILEGYKIGHGSHYYDVFKHSLKVMQKISQDPKFDKHHDKNILLLASLFHDITKEEGRVTSDHPKTGAFDTYFLTKKLNLSKRAEYKLYTLIKNHEWLSYANSFKSQWGDLDDILKNIAYDFRYDNMLDLALIFTHADLRAVKEDNSFHDSLEGSSRKIINGRKRSFGEAADLYSRNIKDLINKLQETQPLLPTTKFPTADKINQAITKVNNDGSTNIKGVYKDKDGLIILNYNEIEDWEKIGFSKGTISKGIKFKTPVNKDINTGNIKFFVHGLNYANQLINFEAFNLPDSNALLSVSYAERPESKYRFFRPQGIILETLNQNIHGGGNSDSGSGTKKTTEDLKEEYQYSGTKAKERDFIPTLLQNELRIAKNKYANFIQTNENKEMSGILPKHLQTGLIKALGKINSNTRTGDRSYNEFYISNPRIIAVYAYSFNNNEVIENPIKFLNRKSITFKEYESVSARTDFLREYALSHNIPFVVFGEYNEN